MKVLPRFLILLVPALACVLAIPAPAQVRDHDIQPEDYFDLTTLGNLAVSPDGLWIAFTESRWGNGKEGRSSDLWIVGTREGAARRLTFDGFGGGSCVWSPDGRSLYCLGRDRAGREAPPHDGSTQVWRIDPVAGTRQAVTRLDGGVESFVLAPGGDAVLFTATEETTDESWSALRKEFPDLRYGHGVRDLTRITRLDLGSWREKTLLDPDRVVWDMALSPDGRKLALITTTDNELIFKEGWSRVEVLDLETGATLTVADESWRRDHKSPYGWIEDLAWAGDSRALAFSISYDGYASQIWVAEEAADRWDLQRVERPGLATYAGALRWRGEGRTLCYLGEEMGRVRLLGTRDVGSGAQGPTDILTEGDWVVGAYAFDRRGKMLAVIAETVTGANDVYAVEGPRKLVRRTDSNPQVATWKLPRIEHVSWTGGDGETCWGILELPPGYRDGDGPLPAVVELHGGPTSSTKYRLRLWIYGRALMASRGYALLSPNYHGSTGYGDAFLEKLIGRENDIEVADIAAGTRWLIDQGIADPDRIGVMGWSNGGYLTNCMIVAEPDLYAAASSGAGVLDMVIQWGTEDTPGHVINFVEGLPWEVADHYRQASPLYGLDRVRTPTLIHVGGSDPRVPPAHSKALYRALHHYLGVPTELVIYPGEPHGLTTHENRLAKMKWDLAWFERYLLGKDPD
ncbi:S9 family peptidase [bacterium]|nr:S9 family peptidase [bacterium]